MRRPDGRFVLHFDDFNFDGYMDMALTNLAPNGIWNFGAHYYWLWNLEIGQFVKNETLSSFWGNLSLDKEHKEIVIYERLGGARHFLYILQYIDGDFVHTRTINNTN